MFGQIPYGIASPFLGSAATKTSFLSKINWSTLLSNTQKTLNVVNQAIPLYYQVKPIFGNIKTLGKISKELSNTCNSNDTSLPIQTNNIANTKEINNTQNNNSSYPKPTFFL